MAGKRKRTLNARPSAYKKRKTAAISRPKTISLARAISSNSMVVYSDFARQLNPGIASVASYIYSLNGLFDPDISGAGQQPTGFDQYMALYERYTVTKVKVTIKMINNDTNRHLVGCNLAAVSAVSTDANVYLRNNNMGYNYVEANTNGGPTTASWSFMVDLAKVFRDDLLTNQDYSGTSAGNPNQQYYLIIWDAPADGSSDVGNSTWTVRLEYYTTFRELASTSNS